MILNLKNIKFKKHNFKLFISNMDFIKKNKILTVMGTITILSFILEKAGIIHP